jgi:hypothetical protein
MWRVARVAAKCTTATGVASLVAMECAHWEQDVHVTTVEPSIRERWAASRLAAVLDHVRLPVAEAQAATTKTAAATEPSRPKTAFRPPNFYPWDSKWDGRDGATAGKGTRRLVSVPHTNTQRLC